jgi:phosphopantetheinyl transferase (holo-ACP synthase)
MLFQAAGLWGLVRNRHIYLPLSVKRLRQYGQAQPNQPVVLRIRMRPDGSGPEQIAVDAEARTEDGRLLQTLEELRMIAHRPLQAHEALEPGDVWQYSRRTFHAQLASARLEGLRSGTDAVLTPTEEAECARLRRAQRRDEWLAARLAAKTLLRDWLRDFHGAVLPLGQIEIAHHPSGEPYGRLIFGPQSLPEATLPPISLTHADGWAVAVLASPARRLRPGVDLEHVEPRSEAFVQSYFHASEAALPMPGTTRRDEEVTALWAIKEAVSKALGTGLRASTFEIRILAVAEDGAAQVELSGAAREAYDRLEGADLRVRVTMAGRYVLAEAYLFCDRPDAPPAAFPEAPAATPAARLDGAGLAAVAALLHHRGLLHTGAAQNA